MNEIKSLNVDSSQFYNYFNNYVWWFIEELNNWLPLRYCITTRYLHTYIFTIKKLYELSCSIFSLTLYKLFCNSRNVYSSFFYSNKMFNGFLFQFNEQVIYVRWKAGIMKELLVGWFVIELSMVSAKQWSVLLFLIHINMQLTSFQLNFVLIGYFLNKLLLFDNTNEVF